MDKICVDMNLLKNKKLSSDSKVLYMFVLARFTKGLKKGNYGCVYSRKEMAEDMNMSERNVIRVLGELKKLNLVRTERGTPSQNSFIYITKGSDMND